ncbi:MAG: type I 3-dehydroquinate dehydratase [Lachnospiraceae bacterium]|nr:type I 3-dehydroquinate dehydratase [Lachnospiraceae bacterium]
MRKVEDYFKKGKSKICVPLMGRTEDEIFENLSNIQKHYFDIIEWRADYYKEVLIAKKSIEIIKKIKNIIGNRGLLFTIRTSFEGGEIEISKEKYKEVLTAVLENSNIDMVDIEFMMGKETISDIIHKAHNNNILVIGSNHDFVETPEADEIYNRLLEMKKAGMDISKIAVMPKSKSDVVKLFEATAKINEDVKDIYTITMSMGNTGEISRVIGSYFGSVMTFGAVGNVSAPGQIEADKLYDIIKKIEMESHIMNENILLIGFMGTGKTSVSRELKKITNLPEIDMDKYIVDREKMSIAEIFDKFGEDYFRKVETECLKEILKNKGLIVSCGGGVVVKDENVSYMKNRGKIVLLTATPETVYERVKHSTERPILNNNMNVEFIGELMEKRRERYLSVADIIIKTDNKSIEDIVKEILDKIGE